MSNKIKGRKTVIEFKNGSKMELNSIENPPIITYPKELVEENPLLDPNPELIYELLTRKIIIKGETENDK